MTRIAVLLTCHNRCEKTQAALRALFANHLPEDTSLYVVLVDDGSTDGTAAAISREFSQVEILHGDGQLFWNRGMHRAQQIAVRSSPDFLLWLNDDTILVPDALRHLVNAYEKLRVEHGCEVMVGGATVDGSSGVLTYGGLAPISRMRKFSFRKVPIANEPRKCEAMNGNIVLVPRSIYECVGPLDPAFEHALGDIDYALRVNAAGFAVFVAQGFQGYCSANMTEGTYLDTALPARNRWGKFKGRKGLPVASWRHFVRRHSGGLWPLYFMWPYVNFALRLSRDEVLSRVTHD